MAVICKWCVMLDGLRGCDVEVVTLTEAEMIDHIESVHHIAVRRHGETSEQAASRHQQQYPESGGPNCKCPNCTMRRRAMTRIGRVERN